MSSEKVDYSNCPSCPEIKEKIDRIDRALLGKDGTGLNDGVIYHILQKLDDLEAKNRVSASWLDMIKPIAISVVITALTTYLLIRFA